MRFQFVLSVLLVAASAHAQNTGIDRQFGIDGILSLRDRAQPDARHLGLAACAAPGGGLNVLVATEATILTLFRIRPDGRTDRQFGNDGIVTMTVPASNEDAAQGACMGDGRIVVARHAPGAGSDMNTQLIRVLANGGLDPAFAGVGHVTLDFDQHVAGLADWEFPLGLNLDARGNILVSMRLFTGPATSRPGLASVDESGTLRFARSYDLPGATGEHASAAGVGPNGRIWLVGSARPNGLPYSTWFRAELDPANGSVLATNVGNDGTYLVDGGRVLANGVMVVAAKYVPQSEPGGPYRPRLLVFREAGTSFVALPAPYPVNNSAPSLSPTQGHGVAIPIADGRVLFGAPLGGNNGEWERATYAAVVELGASAAEDRVDRRFGYGGAVQFAYRTPEPCANGSPTLQRPVRFSNWRGRPVLAGIHATTCANDPRNAFVSTLMLPNDVFSGSFEE